MKKLSITTLLTFLVGCLYLGVFAPGHFAKVNNKVNNDAANLALILPDSDVILAADLDKTLNSVAPILLGNNEKKIANLKKLMRSLENTIGIDPYEINQIIVGLKLPEKNDKQPFSNIDFTAILHTQNSNTNLLQSWSERMDRIRAFEAESYPTKKYITEFRRFRFYKIDKDDLENIESLRKEFTELSKKAVAIKTSLQQFPPTTRRSQAYQNAFEENEKILRNVSSSIEILKTNTNVKSFRDTSIRLQNRLTTLDLDDPAKTKKLAQILSEARVIYPGFRRKSEALARLRAFINVREYQFYEAVLTPEFSVPEETESNDGDGGDDDPKSPSEITKARLEKALKSLSKVPTSGAARIKLLESTTSKLVGVQSYLNLRLTMADEVEKFEEIKPDKKKKELPKSVSLSIKNNAKISNVNGKTMITFDLNKIDIWDSPVGPDIVDEDVQPTATPTIDEKNEKIVIAEKKKPTPPLIKHTVSPKEKEKEEKELFAIGYLDEKTMVFGYEAGIKSILNRKPGYKNSRAAEMVNSFKNPLISFATNSEVFSYFFGVFRTGKDDEPSQIEKFLGDVNIFGSIEYDGESPNTNDILMSLGFTKNHVKEVFTDEKPKDGELVEIGNFQFATALFYDLLNTLKVYRASMTFKFEKQKLAALIESTPQIIQEFKREKPQQGGMPENRRKVRVRSLKQVEGVLTSSEFYLEITRKLRLLTYGSRRKKQGG